MKIKALKIENYVGVREFNHNPSNITILEGPTGSGKSSVLEAIEKGLSNGSRRTEVVSHGENEATIFIETDTHLEVDRKIRTEKADYLKLKQQGNAISSTEKELRKFLSGDIFRPLDFMDADIKKQTEVILNMIKMDYTREEIIEWFKEDVLSKVNTDKHILQILKDIESVHFAARTENNREISTLEVQVRGIEKGLPDNYDGTKWEAIKIADKYAEKAAIEEVNKNIVLGREIKEKFDEELKTIKQSTENDTRTIEIKYREEENDINDIISMANDKIVTAQKTIDEADETLELRFRELDVELNEEIEMLKAALLTRKEGMKESTELLKSDNQELITINTQKISNKRVEIEGLSEKKALEIKALNSEHDAEIEKAKNRLGKAAKYLEENEFVDTSELVEEIEEISTMQGYLREWDRMISIRDGRLKEKQEYSDKLTSIIETARNKPSELLKQHELPIENIGVDEKGMIRIGGTLLDGLSSGEKLDTGLKVAAHQIGELRIICIDGMERLDEKEQRKVIKFCEDNDIQAFITITKETENGEFQIKNEL